MNGRPPPRNRGAAVPSRHDDTFNGATCVWNSVYDGLTHEQTAMIQQSIRIRTHYRGDTLFNIGDQPTEVLIVFAGRIKAYVLSADGVSFTPALYGPGRVTGLISTLRNVPRMMKVVAVDDVRIGSVSKSDLHRLMISIPVFGENVAKLVAAMAADLIWVINERALLPARERLFNALMSLSHPSSNPIHGQIQVVRGLSQEDLAGIVGVSRTWVNLTLAAMEEDGVIARQRMEIQILDSEKVRTALRE
ncbi:Crp/Fnr family transcriptional regulator [Mycolicibacterium sp.]|uniref:Crp/Fnr family transcriptional regulator n=1 Tax=Mycolicibacterium sp. TaxID=2320850 RepID=UPI003D13C5CE